MSFDVVGAQDTLTGLLLSQERLKDIPVKSYRRMRIANEIDYRLLVTRGRNSDAGKRGIGVLVAMPVAKGKNRTVSGPVLDWTFPVVIIEEPNINMDPRIGSGVSCEELGQDVLDIVHNFSDGLVGNFYIEEDALVEEKEFMFPGCIGYRANFHVTGPSVQTGRVAPVVVTVDSVVLTRSTVAAGSMALSCATPGAKIRYTLDGAFPGDEIANVPGSATYAAPVALASGNVIRAVAYLPGSNNSAVRYAAVT